MKPVVRLALPVLVLLSGCQAARLPLQDTTPGPGPAAAALSSPGPLSGARATPGAAPAPGDAPGPAAPDPRTGTLPEVQAILARLGPSPRLVSVVANGSESWDRVGERLQQACREQFPALGPTPVVTLVDRREITRRLDDALPAFAQAGPDASAPRQLAPPTPATRAQPGLTLKKALADCAATPA